MHYFERMIEFPITISIPFIPITIPIRCRFGFS